MRPVRSPWQLPGAWAGPQHSYLCSWFVVLAPASQAMQHQLFVAAAAAEVVVGQRHAHRGVLRARPAPRQAAASRWMAPCRSFSAKKVMRERKHAQKRKRETVSRKVVSWEVDKCRTSHRKSGCACDKFFWSALCEVPSLCDNQRKKGKGEIAQDAGSEQPFLLLRVEAKTHGTPPAVLTLH